ncbi:MAG: NAD-dependent epimerase/dehydratase family protein [Desulfobacterales bacterium]|nr:NAD-dependent epimerase/dehydratase family protein [Desulfobacterales bacterium]
MDTIVITGICGTHGKLLAQRLSSKYKIIGIDHKDWPDAKGYDIKIVKGNLRKKAFSNVLNKYPVKAVIHLAITKHFNLPLEKAHELNVMRTQRIMEGCIKHNIEKVILLSEHSVYGALPDTPMWIKEDAPLNGSRVFKEKSSIITADLMFSELFWKAPSIETVILRPVNVLGQRTRGVINTYLKLKRAPSILGFDPMIQVIHELDVAHAIELSLQKGIKGIFNVTGSGALPLSVLSKEIGVNQIPMPYPIAHSITNFLFKLNKLPFPASALNFFQYSLCIDGKSFKKATNFEPKLSLEETISGMR